MERRFLSLPEIPVKLEERADEKPKITGYASVFYDSKDPGTQFELYPGLMERIHPKAFDQPLKENADVMCLFNHNANMILGRTSAGTVKLAVDGKGLSYECVPGETTVAKDVVEHLRRGDVRGSSFAFRVTDQRFFKENGVDVREVLSVELRDVGPVSDPAYQSSTSGVRNIGDESEVRSAHARWQEEQRAAEQPAPVEAEVCGETPEVPAETPAEMPAGEPPPAPWTPSVDFLRLRQRLAEVE